MKPWIIAMKARFRVDTAALRLSPSTYRRDTRKTPIQRFFAAIGGRRA